VRKALESVQYLEVQVVQLHKDGAISVGAASRDMPLKRAMVGWTQQYCVPPFLVC
jgi:hypothetical protein